MTVRDTKFLFNYSTREEKFGISKLACNVLCMHLSEISEEAQLLERGQIHSF